MADTRRGKASNLVVWGVLGLLVFALAGFGASGFGGQIDSVASVGGRAVGVDDYARALRAEQDRLQAQTGERAGLAQLQAMGVDRQVMEQLLAAAALDAEAERMGLGAGDARVAEEIRGTPGFHGVTGTFDRDTYARALRSVGLREGDYEARIRDEIARGVLQTAVAAGVAVPAPYADRLAGWLAETRDVTLAAITPEDLRAPVPEPDDATLAAWFEDNAERFRTPERRRITYAWITPEMRAPALAGDEAALRALYDARAETYRLPARVLAERLAYPDAAAAEAARAAIEAGTTTFEAEVAARGLTLADVDLGEIARDDVDPAVAEALFAVSGPGLVGPVETGLGPALFRVNAILDPVETPFEDVRPDLEAEYAMDAARREIEARREALDDALASGATLEEIAAEDGMELGTIDWDPSVTEGIAAYEGFRAAAAAAAPDDFPAIEALSDGGLFALRLDEVVAPALPPLDTARDTVAEAWRAEETARALAARAEALAADPTPDTALPPEVVTGVVRDATLEGVPPDVVDRVFAAAPGDVLAIPGDAARAWVVRVDAVHPPDLAQGQGAQLRQAIVGATRQEIAGDLLDAFSRAVQVDLGIEVDDRAVQAVQAEIGGS